MRFAIRTYPVLKPLFWPFGAFGSNSYVQLVGDRLRVRYGPLFNHQFNVRDVGDVTPCQWPMLGGLGWRTDFKGRIGLIGALEDVVCIRFKSTQRVKMLWRQDCDQLYVSLAEPDRFIRELRNALERFDSPQP